MQSFAELFAPHQFFDTNNRMLLRDGSRVDQLIKRKAYTKGAMMAKGETVDQPYTKHFDTLVALVTHLSSIDGESRTVPRMAESLGLEPEEVRSVVTTFPAFFRQSRPEGEKYYTVHLRYARRYNKKNEKVDTEPLSPQELTTLLDLISKMVAQEFESSRLQLDMRERNRHLFWTSLITMFAAITAAVVAIVK